MTDDIRVKQLEIESFRRLRSITIPIGPNVTVIAGQNGTAKSTVLGMLAQPFSFGVVRGPTAFSEDNSAYLSTYHGLKLHEFTDFTDKAFMYDCDDIFRLSREFDYGKAYQYTTKLALPQGTTLPNNRLLTKSRPRKKNGELVGMRFVTGPGASHGSGEGNFPHPVIYLGLNRLWPLAVAKTCTFLADEPTDEDRDWFVEKYSEVLCLNERENDARYIDTAEKRVFVTPKSSDYDGESCSAGQDNLSQILTAILSFRWLKGELGEKYSGGLLLIDELDATLHAFAQDRLLELLCAASQELRLQIVATSHSLRIFEKAFHSKLKKHVSVVYLANEDGQIVLKDFDTYQDIADHLKVEVTRAAAKRSTKVSVLFEDEVGRFLFNQICGSKLRSYIRPLDRSMNAGFLRHMGDLARSLPELKKIILVADGDMRSTWKTPPENLLFLPGDPVRPETLIYRHLYNLRDSDPFWTKCKRTYSKQFAITAPGGNKLERGDEEAWVKAWYRSQSEHWGVANERVFKSWVGANRQSCLAFARSFLRLLKQRYPGGLPNGKEAEVLASLEGE